MIRVAVVGVGNVASALLQSLEYLKQGGKISGLLDLPIRPEEIEVVAAFDIDERKVGKKLSDAIFEPPNVVERYVNVKSDVRVQRGPTKDGMNGLLGTVIRESREPPVDVPSVLRSEGVEVLINLLPTGVEEASEYYAESALTARSSLINASPAPLVEKMSNKFASSGLPLLGDDLISQIGGSALHAGLIDFLNRRGVKVIRSYQVDISGSTETLITLEEWRKDLKKRIKSSYISSTTDGIEVVAGTSDYVPFLGDRRFSYITIEGEYAMGARVKIDISMKSLDGPNAVQPLLDLIRIAKLMRDKGLGGSPQEVCSHYFKGYPRRLSGDTKSLLFSYLEGLK
ncbi:MAG: L-myo-inositol-1-phosphate synthase [Metallosphaera yellowstonensis]